MAGLARTVGKLNKKLLGSKIGGALNKTDIFGNMSIKASDSKHAAENAARDAANQPVMPLPDDEELTRSKRKALARRQSLGRSSTVLGGASETLG